MTLIYFVRHGQSMGNVNAEFHGQYNSDLSVLGHSQACLAGEYLRNKKIDIFYSSDLNRAYQTACHIAQNYNSKVIKNENLREIFAGKWEKMKFSDIEKEYPEEYYLWKNNIAECRCPGGESVKELYERINSEVDKLAKINDGKTICIATHATPLRMLKCAWVGKGVEGANTLKFVPNASVSQVEYYPDGTRKIITDGFCDFLGNDVTVLPKNI